MKILITGVCGFIGSHLAKIFENNGNIVVGLDKFTNDIAPAQYVVDLLKDDLCNIFRDELPDIIIHCAGLADVQYSVDNPNEDFMANTYAVHRILFSMKECSLLNCRFVFLSSAAVYGQPQQLPINEECRLNPLSPYALHKKMAEDICLYFIDNYHFDIKILRIFSSYGPGLKKQLFWDMHKKLKETGELKLWGTGKESRDYIFIDDLVKAIYMVATAKDRNHTIWNVANGEEVTIEKVAKIFLETEIGTSNKVKFMSIVREGDPLNWCADISRLKSLGYKKSVNIEEGIRKYVDWIKRSGE